jgi:4-diphosphocytidyl-2-C-methyl-D-erythritol kinase
MDKGWDIEFLSVFLQKKGMVIFPRSKINIGLRITGKRQDGYHNLQTIFYPVCLCDAIEFIIPKDTISDDILNVTGYNTGENVQNNLVFKAIKKLREHAYFPFLKVHLHKAIPLGAGLGGGSSDASGILKALNRYFDLGISGEKLKEVALTLGSDCPFFIDNIPSYAEGRGEMLVPVPSLPEGLHLVLVNPGIHVNTKEAYSYCIPKEPSTDLTDLYKQDIKDWKDTVLNDFEEPVFRVHPAISELKTKLYEIGALYSSMSGSGSTVYGIFSDEPKIPDRLKDKLIFSGNL